MRNRNNWQITTVKRLRNVLRLITELSYECHDVYEATMDPDGNNRVFGDFDNPVYEFILTFQNGELVCNYDDIWWFFVFEIYSYVFDDFDNPVYELKNTIRNGDIDYNYDDI